MRPREYAQYCGLAKALEIIGERWALLIVRELLVRPKRFSDLRSGLPRIPSNILTDRLKELEDARVVQRRMRPRPEGGIVYELTPSGRQLETAIIHLGRWGAKRLTNPAEGEAVTPDALIMLLRTLFRPGTAVGVHRRYELRVADMVLDAIVDDGAVHVDPNAVERPDLVISSGRIHELLGGEQAVRAAWREGHIQIDGPVELLEEFSRIFHT